MLVAPLPTVAVLQGHTFGAGAFLALAHDRAVMRADRGYFCLPGITVGASYAPGTVALASARLAPRAAHEAMVSRGISQSNARTAPRTTPKVATAKPAALPTPGRSTIPPGDN
ncbi:enoyl-CoA hydratase-related protein [Nocardia miyunensis]|uniref:enoyl-CoA hydratase-related protein n=1 Tax=Nocardia miyunensis TaxID=282684 RepID=UPI00082BA7A4|nr:enoyl-CoA hydratase-related protein [Nocardia miyunensis]